MIHNTDIIQTGIVPDENKRSLRQAQAADRWLSLSKPTMIDLFSAIKNADVICPA